MSRTTITTIKDPDNTNMSDLIQLSLSHEDKERLRCIKCMKYISCPPIRILPNGCNVCAHCTLNPDVITYRNKTLEVILRNVLFPCAFRHNGCFETVPFCKGAKHEMSCSFKEQSSVIDVVSPTSRINVIDADGEEHLQSTENPLQATASGSHSDNSKPIPNLVKSSNSVCEQSPSHEDPKVETTGVSQAEHMDVIEADGEEPSQSTENPPQATASGSRSNNNSKSIPNLVKSSNSVCGQSHSHEVDPKVETASVSQAEVTTGTDPSVCSDTTSTIRSRMNSRSSTNNGQSSNMNRPRSLLNNRSRNNWVNGRGNYSQYRGNQPYHVDWRYGNMYNRQNQFHPDHVMFKRRNNVIIIKGGTFYVNW